MQNKKKGAIPEYIWYIALIAITLGLVVVINTITSKSTKQVTEIKESVPFQVTSFKVNSIPGQDNEVQISELAVLPKSGFKPEDLNALYVVCREDLNHYAKVVCLAKREQNSSVDVLTCSVDDPVKDLIFVSEGNIYNVYNPITIDNDTLPGLNPACYQQGATWDLFYSDPKKKGKLITSTTVS
jgi:hypothetical protein